MNNNETLDGSVSQLSLFSDRFERDEYFTGAGHLNILVNIRRDVAARIPMIVLTGEGGCGKSVMGKMVATEASSGCIVVYFHETIDSFEDVVCVIAGKVDVEVSEISRTGIATAIEQIAASLAQRDGRLLLICDGAEGIYLATLERIRKMLDRLNRAVVFMQVVLVGRPALLDNLRQLSICNFDEVPEKRYVLGPLSFTETRSYIEFCKLKMPEADRVLFTPEVVDRIYQASGGNFRKIHQLAEQFCNRHSKDASFWVLLENVNNGAAQFGWSSQKRWLSLLSPKDFSRKRIVTLGAVAAFGLLLFVFWPGNEDEPAVTGQHVGSDSPIAQAEGQEQLNLSSSDVLDQVDGKDVHSLSEDAVMESTVVVETQAEPEPDAVVTSTVVQSSPEGVPDGIEEVAELSFVSLSEDQKKVEDLLAVAEEAVDAARQVADTVVQVSATEGVIPIGTDSVVTIEANVSESGLESTGAVPVLSPTQEKKILLPQIQMADSESEKVSSTRVISSLPAAKEKKNSLTETDSLPSEVAIAKLSPKTIEIHGVETVRAGVDATRGLQGSTSKNKDRLPIEAESKKIPVLSQAIVPEKVVAADDILYRARLAAGAPWLAGERNDKYTMQLMVLSSDMASENVKHILARREYAKEAERVYVFEKSGNPPTIFMFYGEFSTMAEAQEAKSAMPDSLQKNNPYILPVSGAVQKIQ